MPDFHRASQERINAFLVGDRYLFKHFFEHDEVFERLKPYYHRQDYRFEIPEDEFAEIQDWLVEFGVALVVVDDIEAFAVVVRKYTAHPENIFEDAVLHRSEGKFNVFVLKDQVAVEQAVNQGADRLSEFGGDLTFTP